MVGCTKSENQGSIFTFLPDIHRATTKNFHIASQLTALGLVWNERRDMDTVSSNSIKTDMYCQDTERLPRFFKKTEILQELIEIDVSHSENKDIKG